MDVTKIQAILKRIQELDTLIMQAVARNDHNEVVRLAEERDALIRGDFSGL